MDGLNTQAEIAELQKIRQQTGWWRLGAILVTTLFVGSQFLSVNDSVQGLFQPGTRQTKFVDTLSANVQKDIAPQVQTIAAQTIAETRPEVEASFVKLNGRVPEIAQASLSELETLQTSLPAKGQKILGESFGEMITQKEAKLREMFPDAKEENIKTLTTNLTAVAQAKAISVNDKLFAPHQKALEGIVTHLETIRLAEAKTSPSALGTEWEMALAVMDVVRDDMRELETLAGKNKVAAAKKSSTPPGPKVSEK